MLLNIIKQNKANYNLNSLIHTEVNYNIINQSIAQTLLQHSVEPEEL